MIKGRRLSAVIACAVLAYSLAACGGSGDSSKKVVYINSSGGALDEALNKVHWTPFTEKTGIKVVSSAPVNMGKLVSMVKSGNVEWDITEVSTGGDYLRLVEDGYLEKIDKSQLPMADLPKEAVTDYGVWDAPYSTVLAWDLKKWPLAGKHPTSLMDLWNQKDFPGKRCMQKGALDNIEFGMLKADAAKDSVYPIDNKKAYAALDELKSDVSVWWTSGAQSVQALTNGDCVMGTVWNGRPYEINSEKEVLGIAWDDAILHVSWWVIPKGAPHAANASKLLGAMMNPENSAKVAKVAGYSGPNLKTADFLDENVKPYFATSPEHLKQSLVIDDQWWKENGPAAEKRFLAWVTK